MNAKLVAVCVYHNCLTASERMRSERMLDQESIGDCEGHCEAVKKRLPTPRLCPLVFPPRNES